MKIVVTYNHLFRQSLIKCETLQHIPQTQHHWVLCININGGLFDNGNLIANRTIDRGGGFEV